MIAEHERLWLARNRPGGLTDSLAWLRHLEGCYESGEADFTWNGVHLGLSNPAEPAARRQRRSAKR